VNGGFVSALAAAGDKAVVNRALEFFGYLLGILLVTLVVGQIAALVAFIAIYLRRWGGYNWKVALGYAAGGWVFLYGFYDQVMHIFWHPSLFEDYSGKVMDLMGLPAGLFG